MRSAIVASLLFCLCSCAVSQNPADGGFLGGVRGVAGGGYEERSKELREDVQESEMAYKNRLETRATLEQEIAQIERELASTELEIERHLAALERQRKQMPASVEDDVSAVRKARAQRPKDPSDRLAHLRQVLSKARALAEGLTQLAR